MTYSNENEPYTYETAAEPQGMPRWKLGTAALLVLTFMLWLGGAFAPGPDAVTRHYLDVVLTRGKVDPLFDTSKAEGSEVIRGSVIRGYEVKNVAGDIVAVDVTFESRAGTDLHKTLKFNVKDGEVASIE